MVTVFEALGVPKTTDEQASKLAAIGMKAIFDPDWGRSDTVLAIIEIHGYQPT